MPRVVARYLVGIWLMASAEYMGGPRAQHLRDVSLAVQCTDNAYQSGAAVKSNTIPNHDIGCKTNVTMHNTTVWQPLITVAVEGGCIRV
ncbi:hypothetical protein TNCV_56071 [Trichonephila clavipes]|nr:hypothetical protein TNCV_56071 [Trichonephila clavipes]